MRAGGIGGRAGDAARKGGRPQDSLEELVVLLVKDLKGPWGTRGGEKTFWTPWCQPTISQQGRSGAWLEDLQVRDVDEP